MKTMSLLCSRYLLFLCFFIFSPFTANAAQYSMFTEEINNDVVMLSPSEKSGIFKAAKQIRKVNLLPLFNKSETLKNGDKLLLSLFTNTDTYSATIDRTSTDVNGTINVRGRIDGYAMGYIIISTYQDQSYATITIPELGKQYSVKYDAMTESHYLMEIDPLKTDAMEDAPSPTSDATEPQFQSDTFPLNSGASDPATIDLMIIYTPAAKTWASTNGTEINTVIAQAMEKAQLSLDNSNTLITMRLAYSQEVNYTESGSSSTDLYRLQGTTDGYIDEIHALRDTHGADLVAMFTQVEDTGGIGFLLNTTSGSPSYGFSITRVQQAGWTYTTIHEIGHNMGLHHHKAQTVQPGPGLYSYSAGWRWTGTDSNRYCSVMTYESGQYFADGLTHTRVPHFSDPNISYSGVPTGNAQDANNASNLRQIKHVVASYRQPIIKPKKENMSWLMLLLNK